MKSQKLKGNILLLIAAFVWGLSFIAQSKGVENLSPVIFNGVRSILGGIVLLPVIYIIDLVKKKSGAEVQKADKTLIIGGIVCGLFLCSASTVQSFGMLYTSPGKAGFITALYMIIVPIIKLAIGEKPRPVIILSVLVAVCGMYLMCINSELSINKGDVLMFICAFLFSGHILSIDHFSPKVDGVKMSCIQFFVCGIINMAFAFIFDKPQLKPILDCSIPIAYAGILSCGVGYTLQIVGQKYTDPTPASIIMSLESVFSTLATVVLVACGWQLTGGSLSARELIGCVLMFAAIMLVQLPDKKERKPLEM